MKVGALVLCLLLLVGAGSCRQDDVRTAVIEVPSLSEQADSMAVSNIMRRTFGVTTNKDSVVVDLQAKTVTVRYDSMLTAIKNLEFSLATNGYATVNVPVNVMVAP